MTLPVMETGFHNIQIYDRKTIQMNGKQRFDVFLTVSGSRMRLGVGWDRI